MSEEQDRGGVLSGPWRFYGTGVKRMAVLLAGTQVNVGAGPSQPETLG